MIALPSDLSMSIRAPAAQGSDDHYRVVIHASNVDPTPFLELRILSESYFDTQENRIRCVNRMERGGVAPEAFADQIEAVVGAEHQLELALVRSYRRLVRSVLPGVDEWQHREKGIGEKLLARLLGHLGHPRIAFPYHWEGEGSARKLIADSPFERTASQLRAYCGHGDPTLKKRKGMTAEEAFALGNPHCKMLVHLLAESAMKRTLPTIVPDSMAAPAGCDSLPPSILLPEPSDNATVEHATPNERPAILRGTASRATSPEPNPESELKRRPVRDANDDHGLGDPHSTTVVVGYSYRWRYEQRRQQTADRAHATECIRCGPSGKPALPGSPWSAAHQHADALRIVGKAILDDLWTAAQ